MTKTPSWIALSQQILSKETNSKGGGVTRKAITQYRNQLLDGKALTEKQAQHFIQTINMQLGLDLDVNQPVQISRKVRSDWRKKIGVQTTTTISNDPEALWAALVEHYGSWEAVSHAAIDRLERENGSAKPQSATQPQAALDRTSGVTASVWDNASGTTGNLDYKDGTKEHLVFDAKLRKVIQKLADAPDGELAEKVLEQIAVATDGLESRFAFEYSPIYATGDPKAKKAPATAQCIVMKSTPLAGGTPEFSLIGIKGPAIPFVKQQNYRPSGKQPDIKAFIPK